MKFCLLLVLSTLGCSGSLVSAQREALATRYGTDVVAVGYAPSSRCETLDSRRMWAGAVAQGGLVATGASGLAMLPAEELPESARGPARYTAAGLVIGAGITTAIALVVESRTDEAFVRECLP